MGQWFPGQRQCCCRAVGEEWIRLQDEVVQEVIKGGRNNLRAQRHELSRNCICFLGLRGLDIRNRSESSCCWRLEILVLPSEICEGESAPGICWQA